MRIRVADRAQPTTTPPWQVIVLLIVVLGLLAGCAPDPPSQDRRSDPPGGDAPTASDPLVLVLDSRGRLTIRHGGDGGVLLREYELESVWRRVPAPWSGPEPTSAQERWTGGRIPDRRPPPRREIHSDRAGPPDPAGAVDWIPTPPEEALPAPPCFVVRFDGGATLEVVTADESEGLGWKGWSGAGSRIRCRARTSARAPGLRLVMPSREAGALYRALPDEITFVVDHGAADPAAAKTSR